MQANGNSTETIRKEVSTQSEDIDDPHSLPELQFPGKDPLHDSLQGGSAYAEAWNCSEKTDILTQKSLLDNLGYRKLKDRLPWRRSSSDHFDGGPTDGIWGSGVIKAFMGARVTDESQDDGLQGGKVMPGRRNTTDLGSSSSPKKKFGLQRLRSLRERKHSTFEGWGNNKRWPLSASEEASTISVNVSIENCIQNNIVRGFHSLTGAINSS